MFTGLVENVATVKETEEAGGGRRIRLDSEAFNGLEKGESINVSGACLTVEDFTDNEAVFFLAEETLDRTWFDRLSKETNLNIERSLRADDRMGGHIVQGHVDTVSKILKIEELSEGWNFKFEKPENFERYVVEKGFIAVEGVSLTVTEVEDDAFWVTIIPETWNITNLSEKDEGDYVNLEADITAKYIENIVEKQV